MTKNEMKDEMKCKISMALKDPILQQGFEIICKNHLELEEKISVLLSCKNCPENKGGYICQKEYEDKCLTQKIQYIWELQEEITELKEKLEHRNCVDCSNHGSNIKLLKAKELLNEFMRISKASDEDFEHDYSELIAEAEQFLKEEEKCQYRTSSK